MVSTLPCPRISAEQTEFIRVSAARLPEWISWVAVRLIEIFAELRNRSMLLLHLIPCSSGAIICTRASNWHAEVGFYQIVISSGIQRFDLSLLPAFGLRARRRGARPNLEPRELMPLLGSVG